MKKRNLLLIFMILVISVMGFTLTISSAYLTDRKNETITLKSAKLDNEINISLMQSSIDKATATATVVFTAKNDGNVDIVNQINVESNFSMKNEEGIYYDDIEAVNLYQGEMTDTEIYNDIHHNDSNLAYACEISDNISSVELPEVLVPKKSTVTFTIKVMLNDEHLSGYGNIINFKIGAVAKTKNEAGGYGFTEDLGNDILRLYDNINEYKDDENFNYIENGKQYMVVDISSVYGTVTTESNPILNLYNLPVRVDNFALENSDTIFKDEGFEIRNGKIFGTPKEAHDYSGKLYEIPILSDGEESGCIYAKVKIDKCDISNVTIEEISDEIYMGNAITPSPTITYNGKTLEKDIDYTLSYADNTNAGEATVTITGKGNFTGTISKNFTINKRDITSASVGSISSSTYTGSAITPNPTITYNEKTLIKDTDYTLSYSDNINVGTATVTITGKGNFEGSATRTFLITARNISSASVSRISSYTYTGSAITPNPTITYSGKTLVKDTDYTLSYANNINAGTATVTITGKGNFTGTTSKSFTINKRDITFASVGSISSYTYTGSAVTPTPTVTYNSKALVKDTDYTLSYSNNTNAGTATVTITGKGNFTGTTSKSFTINKRSITSASVGSISSYTYTGSAITPNPTVMYSSKTLVKDTDYTLSYVGNINAGTATVTITGKGNFTGTTSKSFTINKRSITSASVGSISSYTYTGSAITPNPTITYSSKTLVKDTDYTLSYANNINAGTATLTITGKGNFTGTTSKSFTIKKGTISPPSGIIAEYTGDTVVMLTEKQGVEYSKDGTIWQSSNFIQELETETSYTLYCRYAETNNYYASEKSTVQVTTQGEFFFWNGTEITNSKSLGRKQELLVIPSLCTGIDYKAFQYDGLAAKEVIILEGTKVIEYGAFYGNSNMEKITLPSTLSSMGNQIFNGCSNLREVNIYSKYIHFADRSLFVHTDIENGVIRAYTDAEMYYDFETYTFQQYANENGYHFEALDEAITMYSLEIKSELSTTAPTIIPTTRPIVTESPTSSPTPSTTPKNTIQPTAVPTVMPSTMKSTPMPAAIPTTSPTVAPEIIEKEEVTKEIILEDIKDYKTFGNVTQGDITLN